MVNQLLTLSRKHDLFLTPVDLILSIKNVLNICKSTFDKSIEITTQYAMEKAMVMADPAQIEQVILNICVNAMHAMTIMRSEDERQGGSLTIIIDSIMSDVHFRDTHSEANECDYWIIRIRDTGVGMESKVIAKIFDPFFTTKKMNGGTGLGLAMVYNIIQQHNGFIDVYSEPGIGTTFNVLLPKLENVEYVEEKNMVEKFDFSGTGLILIVDDEEVIRKTARKILEHCGYTVLDTAEGAIAISLYRERPAEFIGVLLDMAMPKMSGKEIFAELLKINPDVKAIIASGFMQDKRVEEALHLGVKGFLHKPYSMYDLSKKIKEIFR
jgi:CheY-like chemotaxis protein